MSIEAVKAVLRNSKLALADRLVAIVIAEHTSQKTGTCWPSTERIARMANISRRSVMRALKALSDLGYLRWRGTIRPDGKKGTSIYRLDLKKIKADEIKELDTVSHGGQNVTWQDVDKLPKLDTMSHGGQNVTWQDDNSWTNCHMVDKLPKKLDKLPKKLDKLSRKLDKLSKKEDTMSHITTNEPLENHYMNHYMNHQPDGQPVDSCDPFPFEQKSDETKEGGEDYDIADWSMIDLGEQDGDGELEGDKKKEEKEDLILDDESFKKNEEEEEVEMDENGKATRNIYTVAEMAAFKKLEEAPRLSEDDFERRRQEEREKLARLLEAKKREEGEGQDAIPG